MSQVAPSDAQRRSKTCPSFHIDASSDAPSFHRDAQRFPKNAPVRASLNHPLDYMTTQNVLLQGYNVTLGKE